MLRFLHVLMLNAWREMRRAKGTPAIITVLAAICMLFVGSNAAARSSIQTAMHIVGLPVHTPIVIASQSTSNTGNKSPQSSSDKTKTGSSKKDESPNKADGSNNATATTLSSDTSTQVATASVRLLPPSIKPVCQEGVMLYNVPTAILTLPQSFISKGGTVTWNWDTRIDSGSNSGDAPVSAANHTFNVSPGASVVQINPDNQSTQLVSAAANTNYAYSFRISVDSPFTVDSAWVSVPQSTSSTCP